MGQKKTRIIKDDIAQCKKYIERLRESDRQEDSIGLQQVKYKLANLITKEEMHWKQRAKEYWLKDGDLNTHFFHSVANQRKESNRIKSLDDDNGVRHISSMEFCKVVSTYFENLFKDVAADYEPVMQVVDRVVTDEVNELLMVPFKEEEFKHAIFQMKADKSPGPDGFNPVSFINFGTWWALRCLETVKNGYRISISRPI